MGRFIAFREDMAYNFRNKLTTAEQENVLENPEKQL